MAPKSKKGSKGNKSYLAQFKKGDLVGAKMKGHPIWPGVIESIGSLNKRPRIVVKFFPFSTNMTGKAFEIIKPFQDMTDQEKQSRRNGFAEAVAECEEEFRRQKNEIRMANNDLSITNDVTNEICDSDEKSPVEQSKSNNSLAESAIDDNSRLCQDREEDDFQNQTIEKLKLKLERKMQEKESLKRIRKQRKSYERAAKKFPAVHKKLDQILLLSEKLLIGNKRIITTKLEDAHKNLETTLTKCIDKLTTDYGMRQADSKRFHDKLSKIVTTLKGIRDQDRNQTPACNELARKLLKVYKSKAIKNFINDATIQNGEDSDDVMNDRKENDAVKME